ncbi:hypothetical protein GCM10025873_21230 [Demequina sediminis]|nr:hypothetical protein GCM10025873_21230 [Demequina sediminis]
MLDTPVLPQGIPASWLVVMVSALLFSVAIRSPWDSYAASLRRPVVVQALTVGIGLALSFGAYAPLLVAARRTSEHVAWVLLLSIGAVAAAIDARLAWMPVLLVGLVLEAANNLGRGQVELWLAGHATEVTWIAALFLCAGVAGVLARARDARWYR